MSSQKLRMLFTLQGHNALRKMRRDAVPSNANVITNVYDSDIERSKKYMENLSKDLEPQKTKGELKLSNNEQSLLKNKRKALEYAKDAQNKLEIAVAMKESGKEDEIIIDLWKSCTSKRIVRRKDFERILGRAARKKNIVQKRKTLHMIKQKKSLLISCLLRSHHQSKYQHQFILNFIDSQSDK